MGKTKKFLTSTPALALAAWMGYNIFIKDHLPEIPDLPGIPSKFTAWTIYTTGEAATLPWSQRILPLLKTGLTGKLDITIDPGVPA